MMDDCRTAQDAVCFPIEPFVQRRSAANTGPSVRPRGAFDLEVEAQFVGGDESRFRRTPGMKTHVIQTEILGALDDRLPGGHVGRRITRQAERCSIPVCRETGSADCSAGTAVPSVETCRMPNGACVTIARVARRSARAACTRCGLCSSQSFDLRSEEKLNVGLLATRPRR